MRSLYPSVRCQRTCLRSNEGPATPFLSALVKGLPVFEVRVPEVVVTMMRSVGARIKVWATWEILCGVEVVITPVGDVVSLAHNVRHGARVEAARVPRIHINMIEIWICR